MEAVKTRRLPSASGMAVVIPVAGGSVFYGLFTLRVFGRAYFRSVGLASLSKSLVELLVSTHLFPSFLRTTALP